MGPRTLIIIFLFLSQLTFADEFNLEDKPLYEFGMGGGGGLLSDYPGSDQSHWRGLPFPYFIYRGTIFRSDQRRGTRARLISAKSYELAMSGSGAFPATSNQNDARTGMPNLDWIGEVGPRLIVELSEPDSIWSVSLNIPIRYVFSTDLSSFVHRGYSFTPSIVTEKFGLFHPDSRLAFELTFNFMDESLASYFYEVPATFATASRPAYGARAGYLGTDLSVRFLHPLGNNVRTYSGVGTSYYAGSVNDNSPLMRSQWGYNFSVGLVWVISKSKESVSER